MALTIDIIGGIAHVSIPQAPKVETYTEDAIKEKINELNRKKAKNSNEIVNITKQYNNRTAYLENENTKIDNKLNIANQVLTEIQNG